MLNEDFVHSLPDDPDEALAHLYKMLKGGLAQEREEAMISNSETAFDLEEARRTLLNIVFAFVAAHGIALNFDSNIPRSTENFNLYFVDVVESIEFYIARTSFERAARVKNGSSAIYVLTPDLKTKIHHYLTSIRELIAHSTLSESKRAALSKKLNAFADEVDRNRTRIEALASAMIWTRREIVEGAEGLEPIVEKLEKMFRSFAKATEFFKLPSPSESKQIPAPQKKIEGPKREFDDKVPF